MQKEGVIYKVTNVLNNKCYIGLTVWFNKRKTYHICSTNNPNAQDYNSVLHRTFRKHGIENFIWEILYRGSTNIKLLNELEIFYIDFFNSYRNGYNSNLGGGSNNGYRATTETKLKQAESAKNRPKITEETRIKLSKVHKGRKVSEETKIKISISNSGKVRTQENKDKIAKTLTGKYTKENNPCYGRKASEETKQKMSESKKGFKHSEKSKKQMGLARSGKNNCNYDHTIYRFYHSEYGEERLTRRELIEKYNIRPHKLYRLVYKKVKQHKGWVIIYDNI